MRKLIIAVSIGLLLAGVTLAAGAVASNIAPAEAFALLEKRQNTYLLDVRTPRSSSRRGLPGHISFPSIRSCSGSANSPRIGRSPREHSCGISPGG